MPPGEPSETRKPVKRNQTNRVITCLWKGEGLPPFSNNVYGPQYVEHLNRGVKRHVPNGQLTVLVDDHYHDAIANHPRLQDVRVERFQGHGIGGWSNWFEVCRKDLRPKLGKRHLIVDLDTVFVGNCQWLFDWDKSPVGLHLDPYRDPEPGCGVWTFNFAGAAFLWDAYEVAKREEMREYQMGGCPSEMKLLRFLYRCEGWEPLEPRARKLMSYKAHFSRLRNPFMEKPSIVYFHGRPKPHEMTRREPIRVMWEGK